MHSLRLRRMAAGALMALAGLVFGGAQSHGQAALLLEEPYGFFGVIFPAGHNAIYFQRICAETPIKLRRCTAGELGVVIARYQGISNYDWIAIPLLPYLYSVEEIAQVPTQVKRTQVKALRNQYYESRLMNLGQNLKPGGFFSGGWTELIGAVYERRVFAYRFNTSEADDEALIERLNNSPNRAHFNLFFSNCSDFSRGVLNQHFPGTFKRSIFPDLGITTPKQITSKLVRYARKHPETGLTVFEIPQIRGYRGASRSNKGFAESLSTTGYAIPIAVFNPYLAGGLLLDYLIRGRFHVQRSYPVMLTPDLLPELAGIQPAPPPEATTTTLARTTDPMPLAAPPNEAASSSEPAPPPGSHEKP